jgi:integrase
VRVSLPPKGLPRDRWLTRSEAAKLLWACWSTRETQRTIPTVKFPLRHVARFILIGLYTGTRAAAIAASAPARAEGRAYVDLERGVFYRLAIGKRVTNKRQPPVPLPPQLLSHMRRWARIGLAGEYFVTWHGKPVRSVKKGFAKAVALAGLSGVTPHTLRHTAATWLMQNGVPIWKRPGFWACHQKCSPGYTAIITQTICGMRRARSIAERHLRSKGAGRVPRSQFCGRRPDRLQRLCPRKARHAGIRAASSGART